jgi:hypothetical protein
MAFEHHGRWGILTMLRSLKILAVAALATLGSTAPLQAQWDNINYRSMAMDACSVEGNGGYGSYEICVEQTYSDMINQGRYVVICYVCVPNFTPATEMPCYGSRIAEYCQVG